MLASYSIHTPNEPPDEPGWPFVCKNKTGELDTSCPNWTMKLMRFGHFKVRDCQPLDSMTIYDTMPYTLSL